MFRGMTWAHPRPTDRRASGRSGAMPSKFPRSMIAGLMVLASLGLFSASSPASASGARTRAALLRPSDRGSRGYRMRPSNSNFKGGNGSSNSCRQMYTSNLLVNPAFRRCWPWGTPSTTAAGIRPSSSPMTRAGGGLKSITHPAVGNHEYLTSGGTDCNAANAGATGYFNYFGTAAGQPGTGYYSFDIGTWHLIALNSNCGDAGGCSATSPQGAVAGERPEDAHELLHAGLLAHSPVQLGGTGEQQLQGLLATALRQQR